mmetsp:Transcript_91711/g.172709  ORF Transcript_91711/g.172709 Transcript_91711/m.172709 type:complete len:296 (-) Transcript_91711:1160-2047(-)
MCQLQILMALLLDIFHGHLAHVDVLLELCHCRHQCGDLAAQVLHDGLVFCACRLANWRSASLTLRNSSYSFDRVERSSVCKAINLLLEHHYFVLHIQDDTLHDRAQLLAAMVRQNLSVVPHGALQLQHLLIHHSIVGDLNLLKLQTRYVLFQSSFCLDHHGGDLPVAVENCGSRLLEIRLSFLKVHLQCGNFCPHLCDISTVSGVAFNLSNLFTELTNQVHVVFAIYLKILDLGGDLLRVELFKDRKTHCDELKLFLVHFLFLLKIQTLLAVTHIFRQPLNAVFQDPQLRDEHLL